MDSKGQHRESRQSLGLLASCKLQVPSSCEGLERFKRVLSKSLVIFELFGEHFRTDLENLLSWKFYVPEQTGRPLTLRTACGRPSKCNDWQIFEITKETKKSSF